MLMPCMWSTAHRIDTWLACACALDSDNAVQVKEDLAMERARSAEVIRGRAFLEGRLQEIEASRAALEASLRQQLQQVQQASMAMF
jgi:hypothetical protein